MTDPHFKLPDSVLYSGQRPTLFIWGAPADAEKVESLADTLLARGFAIAQCFAKSNQLQQALLEYDECVARSQVPHARVAVAGIGGTADMLAAHFNDFNRIVSPCGAILLGTRVGTEELNRLTCPYLVLHGSEDPVVASEKYASIEAGIHHHQQRYGDTTTQVVLNGLGVDLGNGKLDSEVLVNVYEWLKKAIREDLRHHQEPAPSSSSSSSSAA